jgi:hypothetical protein
MQIKQYETYSLRQYVIILAFGAILLGHVGPFNLQVAANIQCKSHRLGSAKTKTGYYNYWKDLRLLVNKQTTNAF